MAFNLLCILSLTYPMDKLTLLVFSCCSLGSVYERDRSPKSTITQSLGFLMTPQRLPAVSDFHTQILFRAAFIFTFLTECLLYDSHDFCQHHIAVMYIIRKENRK